VRSQAGQFEDARNDFDLALRFNPHLVSAYRDKGAACEAESKQFPPDADEKAELTADAIDSYEGAVMLLAEERARRFPDRMGYARECLHLLSTLYTNHYNLNPNPNPGGQQMVGPGGQNVNPQPNPNQPALGYTQAHDVFRADFNATMQLAQTDAEGAVQAFANIIENLQQQPEFYGQPGGAPCDPNLGVLASNCYVNMAILKGSMRNKLGAVADLIDAKGIIEDLITEPNVNVTGLYEIRDVHAERLRENIRRF
jgi:tetratricopeptide (TPR) repeat protein